MLSYPYLESLFRAVLSQSSALQGRFYICPHWGSELNAGNLEQVLTRTLGEVPGRKYPLCVMMPPRSSADFSGDSTRETYALTLLFLTTTYTDGTGAVKAPNPDTGTSMHRITDDWHDMKRCAANFLRVLGEVATPGFGVSESAPQYIDPVSTMGDARLSGVMLQFQVHLFTGCQLEDYPVDFLSRIQIPALTDEHPEHA